MPFDKYLIVIILCFCVCPFSDKIGRKAGGGDSGHYHARRGS